MFTHSLQEKIVEFIKHTPKVYIRLILNTVLLPEWSTAVFFLFSDSCSWVPCLSWTVKPSAVLQKNYSGPTNSLVFQHFCVFEPFPTMTVWFWDPSFLKKKKKRVQLKDSFTTFTEDANAHWFSRRKNHALRAGAWIIFLFKNQGKFNLICLLENM